MTEQKTIRVDDIDYIFNDLPSEIQDSIIKYEIWSSETTKHKLEAQKAEIAAEVIKNNVVEMIRKHNANIVRQMQEAPCQPDASVEV